MRTLILGANGQLGQEITRQFHGFSPTCLSKEKADITNQDELPKIFADLKPQLVFNCAAYNRVDDAEEKETQKAFAVNAFAVRNIAAMCRRFDSTLFHFSSDYVFGNNESRIPLTEENIPAPINTYGISKLTGEHFARMWEKTFIIRTCGLYGRGATKNFVDTMLKMKDHVKVVHDQFCTPTYVYDLVQPLVTLVRSNLYGTYHITNNGYCSWHEFAVAIFSIRKLPIMTVAISSQEYGAIATRPYYSILSNCKLKKYHGITLRHWRDALVDYLKSAT